MSSLAERIAQEATSGGIVEADRRRQALERLTAEGLPTTRDENWKYANLRPIEKVRFAPAAPANVSKLTADQLPPTIDGYARFTFVDGVFVAGLSQPAKLTGVVVRSLRADDRAVAAAAAPAHGPMTRPNSASAPGSAPAPNSALAPGSAPAPGSATARAAATATGGSALSAAAADVAPAQATKAAAIGSEPAKVGARDQHFALLNDAFATDGAVIDVGANVDCPACVEIIFVATEPAQNAASYPRLEINVANNARLGLIERHISLNNDANFVNGAVTVNLARGSQVKHHRVQQAGAKATWFDTLNAKLEQDSRYEVHAVNLGALSARSTANIQLVGHGAELALHVVSLGDQQQVHDGFALVEHIAANTKSEQNVRAIAGGRSRVAFNSKVVVREHAKGTDSKQSLRGLLAGTQAEIDVRPQLEIYTDDVRCNHGATAGKLDDNMLFYLLSRGIDRDTAQQLLKWAFLEDVVSRIDIPDLRKHIETSLAGQMQETAALKDLI